jgi:hypothetical protein
MGGSPTLRGLACLWSSEAVQNREVYEKPKVREVEVLGIEDEPGLGLDRREAIN